MIEINDMKNVRVVSADIDCISEACVASSTQLKIFNGILNLFDTDSVYVSLSPKMFNCKETVYFKVIKCLVDNGLLKRVEKGTYMINPRLVFNNHISRFKLLTIWDNL